MINEAKDEDKTIEDSHPHGTIDEGFFENEQDPYEAEVEFKAFLEKKNE